jgi:hypothetical protein
MQNQRLVALAKQFAWCAQASITQAHCSRIAKKLHQIAKIFASQPSRPRSRKSGLKLATASKRTNVCFSGLATRRNDAGAKRCFSKRVVRHNDPLSANILLQSAVRRSKSPKYSDPFISLFPLLRHPLTAAHICPRSEVNSVAFSFYFS